MMFGVLAGKGGDGLGFPQILFTTDVSDFLRIGGELSETAKGNLWESLSGVHHGKVLTEMRKKRAFLPPMNRGYGTSTTSCVASLPTTTGTAVLSSQVLRSALNWGV
jgi:hypothetical protein